MNATTNKQMLKYFVIVVCGLLLVIGAGELLLPLIKKNGLIQSSANSHRDSIETDSTVTQKINSSQ